MPIPQFAVGLRSQRPLQIVAPVSRVCERVVQYADDLSRFNVDRVLVAEGLPLDAGDIEEIVVEAPDLALRVRRIPPVHGESPRSGADLIPRQAYVLHDFPVEIVLVDPLDLVTIPGAHTNVVRNCKIDLY